LATNSAAAASGVVMLNVFNFAVNIFYLFVYLIQLEKDLLDDLVKFR